MCYYISVLISIINYQVSPFLLWVLEGLVYLQHREDTFFNLNCFLLQLAISM